eukprot:CAMPEP_0179000126 /NCGR_PEP_ID=MMETSP0795-20121207/10481_1 /TAXON_ID=88552 /ORGANISM="Amoebophrya sp., Strain Ameob2" /LENGTH=121 /DNA_ID=CAMNT_0020693053 /DNA_START=141 /DNA_END=506 /DNA_ORIENTATION=-
MKNNRYVMTYGDRGQGNRRETGETFTPNAEHVRWQQTIVREEAQMGVDRSEPASSKGSNPNPNPPVSKANLAAAACGDRTIATASRKGDSDEKSYSAKLAMHNQPKWGWVDGQRVFLGGNF